MKNFSRVFVCLIVFLTGCNDIESRPELVSKLRTIGVQVDRLNYIPSSETQPQTGRATFFFAAPLGGEQLNITPSEKRDTVFVPLTFADPEPAQVYADFRILAVSAEFIIPTGDLLGFQGDFDFSYFDIGQSFRLGNDEEQVQYRVKVYRDLTVVPEEIVGPEPEDVNNWTQIAITAPAVGAAVPAGTVELAAKLSSEQVADRYRISWLVGAGEIGRNRNISTEWEEVPAGKRSVIVSVRGLDSGLLQYDVKEFTAE